MLRTWFGISPDAMVAVNQEGSIVLANAPAQEDDFFMVPRVIE